MHADISQRNRDIRRLARAPRAAVGATLLTVMSIGCYPGGTPLDPATSGYSPVANFLSDLGMTAAYNGSPNRLGAACFVGAMVLLVAGFGGCIPAFLNVHEASHRARQFARSAAAISVVVALAFVGVALTPENRAMTLHVALTFLAFRLFPLAPLALAAAAWVDSETPRRIAHSWLLLGVLLSAYALVQGLGPSPTTRNGLVVQVVAQKLISVSVVILVSAQCVAVSRFLIARRDEVALT